MSNKDKFHFLNVFCLYDFSCCFLTKCFLSEGVCVWSVFTPGSVLTQCCTAAWASGGWGVGVMSLLLPVSSTDKSLRKETRPPRFFTLTVSNDSDLSMTEEGFRSKFNISLLSCLFAKSLQPYFGSHKRSMRFCQSSIPLNSSRSFHKQLLHVGALVFQCNNVCSDPVQAWAVHRDGTGLSRQPELPARPEAGCWGHSAQGKNSLTHALAWFGPLPAQKASTKKPQMLSYSDDSLHLLDTSSQGSCSSDLYSTCTNDRCSLTAIAVPLGKCFISFWNLWSTRSGLWSVMRLGGCVE